MPGELTPPGRTERPAPQTPAVGLRLIVGYKFLKAFLECVIGGALVVSGEGASGRLRAAALTFQQHATRAWSIELAGRMVQAATERAVLVVALAAFLDGALSFLEGWALYRRWRGSGWFVVGTTSSLLPFEAAALVRHFTAGRAALLVANALIVIYLVRRPR